MANQGSGFIWSQCNPSWILWNFPISLKTWWQLMVWFFIWGWLLQPNSLETLFANLFQKQISLHHTEINAIDPKNSYVWSCKPCTFTQGIRPHFGLTSLACPMPTISILDKMIIRDNHLQFNSITLSNYADGGLLNDSSIFFMEWLDNLLHYIFNAGQSKSQPFSAHHPKPQVVEYTL